MLDLVSVTKYEINDYYDYYYLEFAARFGTTVALPKQSQIVDLYDLDPAGIFFKESVETGLINQRVVSLTENQFGVHGYQRIQDDENYQSIYFLQSYGETEEGLQLKDRIVTGYNFWTSFNPWIYIGNDSPGGRAIDIFHADLSGNWTRLSPTTYLGPYGHPVINVVSTSDSILAYPDRSTYSSGFERNAGFSVLDLRDPGRPRKVDLQGLASVYLDMESVGETILAMTEEGYWVLDSCGSMVPEELPFGWVDFPVQNQTVTDPNLWVYGWALDTDDDGITSVHVYIDASDDPVEMLLGWDRPDLTAARPGYPEAAESGFAGLLDLSALSDGAHRLTFVATDGEGRSSHIGIVDVEIDISSSDSMEKVPIR